MKKKRTISIKNPKLRKVRDNLRLLLLEATTVQWRKYFDERHRLNTDLNGNIRNLSESKKPRAGELTKKMREIDMLEERSIIRCPACRKIDRDMTFNPELKQWYCTQCYREMGEFYYSQKEARAKGLVHDDFHEGYYKTFLD
jgi:hypothetical protein